VVVRLARFSRRGLVDEFTATGALLSRQAPLPARDVVVGLNKPTKVTFVDRNFNISNTAQLDLAPFI